MMGIGFTEMLVIAGIALIVIGPEKFPDFAKLVVRTIRDLRGYVDDVKQEVAKELKPLKDEVNTLTRIDPEKYIDSLTSEAPSSASKNTSIHEQDKKIMDGGSDYGEDSYGWEDNEPGGYGQDPSGTPPEETVGYGEDGVSGEVEDAPEAEDKTVAHDDPASEFESFRDPANADGNGEPDAWTGR